MIKKEVRYDTVKEVFEIKLEIPRKKSGEHTYGYGGWTTDAVCVCINLKWYEYTLNESIYPDYKNSLQCGKAILNFESEEEATQFAKDYGLMIIYIE